MVYSKKGIIFAPRKAHESVDNHQGCCSDEDNCLNKLAEKLAVLKAEWLLQVRIARSASKTTTNMEQERLSKGIWIPIEIWKDKNLTWNEKILFLEIDSYTSREQDCFFSNEHISELLGISETNANKTLSSLINKGYVIKTKFDGRRRYVKTALSYSTTLPCQERQPYRACDSNINNIDNSTNDILNKTVNKEKEKELKEKFAEFVKLYKKLTGKTTRSVETEFKDFSTRHKNWMEIVPYLSIAIERETKAREQAKVSRTFFPEPKMLQTYLGKQKAWELYVNVGDDVNALNSEYLPQAYNIHNVDGVWLMTGMYFDGDKVFDGYEDDKRPDGATIKLNNGQGTIMWSVTNKRWERK